MVAAGRYLIARDPNESDLKEMQRWHGIYQAEVQRIVNVLNYWSTVPLKCGR